MKLLYHGNLQLGSTALHRLESFRTIPAIQVETCDIASAQARAPDLVARLRWRLGWPDDYLQENARLLRSAATFKPDAVLVDNSRVITRSTLKHVRRLGVRSLAYYSPDDLSAPHNLSWPLRLSFPEWDIVFTTKTYNVAELRSKGVKNPVLMGNGFSSRDHRPFSKDEIGPDFEKFDLVFIGTYEIERGESIRLLAEAGLSVVVYGNDAGMRGKWQRISHPNIFFRPPAYGKEYSRCLHHGKVALCFLRKANRDKITTRSIEITAAARPMLAEKTDEHDAFFADGMEYVGFTDNMSLIAAARHLISHPEQRATIGRMARQRCLTSGYDNDRRAAEMLGAIDRSIAPASL
jgi:hypothetical protein